MTPIEPLSTIDIVLLPASSGQCSISLFSRIDFFIHLFLLGFPFATVVMYGISNVVDSRSRDPKFNYYTIVIASFFLRITIVLALVGLLLFVAVMAIPGDFISNCSRYG